MTYPNWFAHYAVDWFRTGLKELVGKPHLRFLQIGVFTGDATMWLLDNVLTGQGSYVIDVDTWAGSDEPEHEPFDWADIERVYDERVSGRAHVFKYKGTSSDAFCYFDGNFDFIYIDGDHTAAGVLTDAVNAIQVLKPGGILAFDDYQWQSGKGRLYDPGPAIDVVADVFSGQLEMLATGLQVWFRKI